MTKSNASVHAGQLKRLEGGPSAISAAARDLADDINHWFPVEGRVWVLEGTRDIGSALRQVYNAHVRLTKLLNPHQNPARQNPEECPLRSSDVASPPIHWRSLGHAVDAVIQVSDLVARHYGWASVLYGGPQGQPWESFVPPPISHRLLEQLRASADNLDRVVLQFQA